VPRTPKKTRSALDLHRSGRTARNVTGNDGEGSLTHIRQHRPTEIVRSELEFVESQLAVWAGGKDHVVDKRNPDCAVGASFDDVLLEQGVPNFGRQALRRAFDHDLPSHGLYLRNRK
jgi:hypothetical protein